MFLSGIGTAVPPNRYTQAECLSAYERFSPVPGLNPGSDAIIRRVLNAENGIGSRHLALESLEDAFHLHPEAMHSRFVRNAPVLGTEACLKSLADAQLLPSDIDAIIISTCTGYLCPGLSSYVIEGLGLRPDVLAFDLVGQGCGAALPNLRLAESLLMSSNVGHVLSVCVEVCSAALYFDNDPGVLISACIFGDGAAATVWSKEPSGRKRRVEWVGMDSIIKPKYRDALKFEQRNGMLRNVLTRQVPVLAANLAREVLSKSLDARGLDQQDIRCWILHAGGREVLRSIQKRLGLEEPDLLFSTSVLYDFGNLSSPFVLFTLERALTSSAPGGWWWMSSFGAGFSCHGALLRVD